VSSLDLATQARILTLLADLRQSRGTAYLFVTHDLRLVRGFAARCYVMEGGRPVEVGDPWDPAVELDTLRRLRTAILPQRPSGPAPGGLVPA
jgi:nickel transport system ATP-binding protein